MANFRDLAKICGKKKAAGTEQTLYWCPLDEINGWPQTKEELGGSAPGDSKVYGEAFDFSTAPTDKGYWRQIPILVNTGAVNNESTGDVGSLTMENRVPFFIPGTGAEQLETIDCFLQYDGCLAAIIPDKNGNYHVVGSPENPCFMQEITGGTGTAPGDRNGHAYTAYSNSGAANMLYDPILGIDITPNV